MRKKLQCFFRAFTCAFIFSLIVSCGGNDIKKVNVDNQFAISLFADTILIEDLMSNLDSSFYQYIKIRENGDIYAYYADSVKDIVKADDVFGQLPDVDFTADETFEMPTIPAELLPMKFAYPFDELFSMPFEYEGYEITSVLIKEGDINIRLSTDMNFIDTLTLFSQNIILENGNPLEIVMLMNQEVQEINIPLENCEIKPKDGKLSFGAKLAAVIEEDVAGSYVFNIEGEVTNLDFKTIDGSVDDLRFEFVGSQPISFGFPNLTGDFKLMTPEFNIKYHNSFGFKVMGTIDELYLSSVDGTKSDLKSSEKITFELHHTDEGYEEISNFSDQFADHINILGNYNSVTFDGDVVVGCDNLQDYLISDESHIDLVADLTLPLKFNINELRYKNTFDFNLSMSDEDMSVEGVGVQDVFDEIEFKMLFKNKMPFQIQPQIYLMYQGEIIDSLFSSKSNTIHGCFDGKLIEDVLLITVKEDKLKNVQLADQLCIDLRLSSLGKTVVINTKDYFDLKLGIKTKTSEINLKNLNK